MAKAAKKKAETTQRDKKSFAGNKPIVVKLPTVLDITNAGDFLRQVRGAAAEAGSLVLQGAAVERITTPCIQIIISAAKTLAEGNGSLKLEAPSDALRLAMEDLGFSEQLTAWSA